MRVSRRGSKSQSSESSTITSNHVSRLNSSGSRSNKNFVDPCKIFVGNIPYTTSEKQLKEWVLSLPGIPPKQVQGVKLIADWKTGASKGYGFVQFYEPVFATSCLEFMRGKKIDGRVVRFTQGKRKIEDGDVIMKKKGGKRKEGDEVDAVIDRAIDEIDGVDDVDDDEEMIFEDVVDDDDDIDDTPLTKRKPKFGGFAQFAVEGEVGPDVGDVEDDVYDFDAIDGEDDDDDDDDDVE